MDIYLMRIMCLSKMPCPKCNGVYIVLAGSYKVKRTNRKRIRMRCKDCKCHFTLRDNIFRKKLGLNIRHKILELYKTKKYHINKFDPMRRDRYSTREVATILNVSKSFVHSVVQEYRTKEG